MTDTHTPGPWSLWGEPTPSLVIEAPDGFVAQTIGGNDVANARLIAASTVLLDRLESALKALHRAEHELAYSDELEGQWIESAIIDTEQAIKLAREGK